MAGDFTTLRKGLASIKLWHVVVFVIVVGGFVGLQVLKSMGFSTVDRSDYKVVATRFCEDNGRIARELGKIISVKVLGAGRGANKSSFCSMSVRGEDGTGNAYIQLVQDDKKRWFVDSATLMTGGRELNIPVSRKKESRSMKVFGN